MRGLHHCVGHFGRAIVIMAAILGASRAEAATVSVTWTAPTTNVNGTALTDLAGYRIYLGTSTPACPGGSFHAVASPTSRPASAQSVNSRITGLTASATYFVRVTAVDTSGNESGCSTTASGVATTEATVTPTTTVSFGSLATGATADRTFTVQNTSTTTVSGSANAGAPFSIVAGGSFSLAPGASQAVVVRFRPTTAGTFAGNANFTVNGDTLSRPVSGAATGSSTVPSPPPAPPSGSTGPLAVFITQPKGNATIAGSGTAVLWVEGTSGSSNTFTLAVDGVTRGSQTTASRGPVTLPWTSLSSGTHTLTATVRDAAGRSGSTSITVAVTGSSAPPPSSPPSAPPPPPPPPAPNGSLRVFITQPTGGATIGGSGTAVLWVEGTSGSANTFTLSVDGAVRGTQTTSARGPVTLPWTSLASGTHTFTATVRDAAGNTGSTSLTVTVTGGTASAPPPPAPAPADTLKVFITAPAGGATLSGTAWVVLWVEGTSGSSNTFTLSVDGTTVGTQTTSARGPVSIPWTTSGASGSRTLTAVVRDASGHTGRTSIAVTVRN